MFMWFVICILIMLMGLGSVAFLTLLERKMLGLSQVRLGPNKTSFTGLLQPVLDGVKLLMKELFIITSSQNFLFNMSPSILFIIFLIMWVWVTPWCGFFFIMKYSSLFYFTLLGLSAYSIILTGWSSVSAFSKLGSLRGMLQSLSFEVALIFILMSIILQKNTLFFGMENLTPIESNFLWMMLWLLISLMETGRAPFDLLEGESELISGFNIEMGSTPFVFLFLSEYGTVIFMSVIISSILLKSVSWVISFMFCLMIFMRSCFPRIRYDIMMSYMWKCFLPLTIILFMMSWTTM